MFSSVLENYIFLEKKDLKNLLLLNPFCFTKKDLLQGSLILNI